MLLGKHDVKAAYDSGARRHPRALFSVPMEIHHLGSGGIRKSRALSLDLGEGGIGALVQEHLQVGETVAIDFPLLDRLLTAVAIVRYSSSCRSGFEFVGLTLEERSQIMSALARTKLVRNSAKLPE